MNLYAPLILNTTIINRDETKKLFSKKIDDATKKAKNFSAEITFNDTAFVNGYLVGYKINATKSGSNITMRNHVNLEKFTGLLEGRDYYYDFINKRVIV